jgi:hypothetical protein
MQSKIIKRFIRILFLAAFVVPCISTAGFAAIYYVDNVTGSDSNSGLSSNTPWKTIAKVNSAKYLPGDKILFASGRIWREGLIPSSSGTSGNPITFGAYGTGEKPTISGANVTYTVTMNKSYVTLDGLHITEGGKNNIGHTAFTDHCIIQNCLIDKAVRMGIYTGQSATVNATNWIVQYNTFAENGTTLTQDHGIYCKWDKNWTIQYNKFLRNKAFGINLNGTSNCIVRYNYSEGNLSGFMELYQDTAGPSNYNQIYYNISNGDRKLLFVGGGSGHTGNVVYNNTVYGFVYAALDIENNANLAEVKNNIFWSTVSGSKSIAVNAGSYIQSSSNNNLGTGTISYNGSYFSSLDAFKRAYPNLEVNSISAVPLFVSSGSDFHLTSNSPCINKGVNLSLSVDFDGNYTTSGGAPDIGAFEYVGSTTVSNPVPAPAPTLDPAPAPTPDPAPAPTPEPVQSLSPPTNLRVVS